MPGHREARGTAVPDVFFFDHDSLVSVCGYGTRVRMYMCMLEVMVVGNDVESDCRIPAGWSAAGQPNDAIHQFWHSLRKARERVSIGCQSD